MRTHMEMQNENHQKIFSLIYNGSTPNDKLAFEIIKNLENDTPFFPSLIAISLTNDDKIFAEEIFIFIEPRLTSSQRGILQRHIGISSNNRNIHFFSIRMSFPHQLCAEIIYTNYRRTGRGVRDFLCADNGSHPERANMFQVLMDEPFYRVPRLFIPGLLPDEMEIYAQKVFANNPQPIYNSIRLQSLKSDEIPEIVFSKKYNEVRIEPNVAPKKIPDYIFNFSILKSLIVQLSADMEFPKDWSSFSDLVEIHFAGKDFVFDQFDFIDTLPKLRNITLGQHYISNPNILLRKKMVPISGNIKFLNRDGYADGQGYQKAFILDQKKSFSLAGAIGKSILSMEEQQLYFKKLTALKQLKYLEKLPLNHLLALMNINFSELRDVVQKQLDELSEKQNGISTLNEKSLLYLAGTPNRKKTEIKQKLKELNIPLTDNPLDDITHLVICKNPKKYAQLVNRDLLLISEQALYQLFKANAPGFIEAAVSQGDDAISDNILQLIYSDDIPNLLIGLEMLKNGGVPNDLVEPLLVIFKTCSDTKARGLAKKLLLQHSPAEFLPLINDSQRFTGIIGNSKAQDINKKLEKIAKTSSRNLAARLSILFHKRYTKGLRYVLYHFHEPCQERTEALLAMMEGTHFNFAAGLGFTNWKERDAASITLYNMKTPAKFPIDIIDHTPVIESANFHNCKMTSLHKNIGGMKDLKRLDLSFNFIKTLPKSFEKLTQLEHLDLQMNSFKSFPLQILKLPNLKIVDFRNNQFNGMSQPLEIPAEIKEALKGCEVLV